MLSCPFLLLLLAISTLALNSSDIEPNHGDASTSIQKPAANPTHRIGDLAPGSGNASDGPPPNVLDGTGDLPGVAKSGSGSVQPPPDEADEAIISGDSLPGDVTEDIPRSFPPLPDTGAAAASTEEAPKSNSLVYIIAGVGAPVGLGTAVAAFLVVRRRRGSSGGPAVEAAASSV